MCVDAPLRKGAFWKASRCCCGISTTIRIDWTRPARAVLRHVHGLSPFPGAWCEIAGEGEPARLKILRCELADGRGAPGAVLDDHLAIACGDGAIRILDLQRAGKAPMKAAGFLRGTPLKPPARLG